MLHVNLRIGHLALEKKSFQGFYQIRSWRPSWSFDLDHFVKLSFPLPMEAPREIYIM